jgi:hypothetical protein
MLEGVSYGLFLTRSACAHSVRAPPSSPRNSSNFEKQKDKPSIILFYTLHIFLKESILKRWCWFSFRKKFVVKNWLQYFFCIFSSIPPEYMQIKSSLLREQSTASVDSIGNMMIPPCVRIEGCTPPSDSSVDADLDQCKHRPNKYPSHQLLN